jgi:type II secretory pathway predicted ATPase ExeA
MSLLYLDHFGLKKPPFKITPDLDFFFAGGRRGDILSALLHVAKHEEGIITVVAEVGSGKTLLSRLMISQLGPQVSTVYLPNPCFSRDEILSAIARDLGLTDLPASTEAKLSTLQQELLRRHAQGKRVLLVVDEAHAMPPESLEEIRLLSNLETESHKLVNIMLFGQPELDTLLTDPRLRQVRDRVIHRFELQALPHAEACAYIDHRLRAAGWKGGALFSPAALALLVKASAGRARRINLLADKALLGAYADAAMLVDGKHVQGALSELHIEGVNSAPNAWVARLKWGAACVVLAGVMATVAVWLIEQSRPQAVQPTEVMSVQPSTEPPTASVPKTADVAATASTSATAPTPDPAAQLAPPTAATSSSYTVPSDVELQSYLLRTQALLKRADARRYTLQIAAIPRDVSAQGYLSFAGKHIDSSALYVQYSTYNGRNFVSVYYGSYATMGQATAALAGLPEALRYNKPIVRTWARIKQDQAF